MTFAPRSNLTSAKMQTKMSTWTPLNHQPSNNNVFEERRNLLGKWFDKWSDGQRKAVLQDFFSRCSAAQLRSVRQGLVRKVPSEAEDPASVLPRVLSLYVLSFLDPRSLCRCAQVSWTWRGMVELDQLWMPKCLKLGWCISFSPTPFEQGVWKRHYIETVRGLHTGRPKTPAQQQPLLVPEVAPVGRAEPPDGVLREVRSAPPVQRGSGSPGRSLGSRGSTGTPPTGLPPPWRGSDRHPKDTLRFNYLENLDPIEQSRQAQTKSCPSKTKQDATVKKPLSAASYKLRKAKSLMFLSLDLSSSTRQHHHPLQDQSRSRPDWAARCLDYPVSVETAQRLSRSAQWNAGIRPGPVRRALPRLSQEGLRASQRTSRSALTKPLFDGQPWKVAVSSHGSDQE